MKILVVSSSAWNENNSFGNTFSNLFSDMEHVEIANIYCSGELPKNDLVSVYYQMSDASVFRHILHREKSVGRTFRAEELPAMAHDVGSGALEGKLPHYRPQILYVARSLLWRIGGWKTRELKEFIHTFKPDLLCCPLYSHEHMLRLVIFLQTYTGLPSICYMADDGYTLRQFRFSPVYWLRRFNQRRLHRICIRNCELLYVISQYQKQVYEKIFSKPCKVLCKCLDFSAAMPENPVHDPETPVSFTYTGNIGSGRWRSLALLVDAIRTYNETHAAKAVFHLYTATEMTPKIRARLVQEGACIYHGSVNSEKIPEIQRRSDYLVHAESFSRKYICQVRLSFSTKIIDYIRSGRPIFAIGPLNVASMRYLTEENISVAATSPSMIAQQTDYAIEHVHEAGTYARRAWNYAGERNDADRVKREVYHDLLSTAAGRGGRLRILAINAVCGQGSTGRAILDIARYMEHAGHEYAVAYAEGSTDYERTYKIGSRLDRKIHALLAALTGNICGFSRGATRRLLRYIDGFAPDVINLRNLHCNAVHLPMLLKYLAEKKIPTILSLDDCFFFTGKCCHYTLVGCDGWQKTCGHCPKLRNDNRSILLDRTPSLLRQKERLFAFVPDLAVVGVSDWITNEAKRSILRDARIIRRIYNGVDLEVFSPMQASAQEQSTGEDGSHIVLGVMSGVTREKGFFDFLALSRQLPPSYQMILIGPAPENTDFEQITHIRYVDSASELATYYSGAMALFNPSMEESFGMVTAEALACGTPVIVFDSTASPELVGEKCGYVVNPHDLDAVVGCLEEIRENGKEFYTSFCRKRAETLFSREANCEEYRKLYCELAKGTEV